MIFQVFDAEERVVQPGRRELVASGDDRYAWQAMYRDARVARSGEHGDGRRRDPGSGREQIIALLEVSTGSSDVALRSYGKIDANPIRQSRDAFGRIRLLDWHYRVRSRWHHPTRQYADRRARFHVRAWLMARCDLADDLQRDRRV